MGNSLGKKVDYSVRAPYDKRDPRFVQSFNLEDDPKEIQKFYDRHGFVVFDNILNEQELQASIQDIWASYEGAKQDDPETWRRVKHPFGFVGEAPIEGLQMWNNRQHPNVYQAFKRTYEAATQKPLSEPLVACLDRGNLMLPTKGDLGKFEYTCARAPHFDLNPFYWCGHAKQVKDEDDFLYTEMYNKYFLLLSEGNNTPSYGYPKLRAVLQISESTAERGGLEVLPGFHNQIHLWCQLHSERIKKSRNPYGYGIEYGDPIDQNMQKITVRKGSIIVFTAELPHTMFPNESDQFRYAQYLRMAPLSTLELDEERLSKRKQLVQEHLPPALEVTEVGREVFLL